MDKVGKKLQDSFLFASKKAKTQADDFAKSVSKQTKPVFDAAKTLARSAGEKINLETSDKQGNTSINTAQIPEISSVSKVAASSRNQNITAAIKNRVTQETNKAISNLKNSYSNIMDVKSEFYGSKGDMNDCEKEIIKKYPIKGAKAAITRIETAKLQEEIFTSEDIENLDGNANAFRHAYGTGLLTLRTDPYFAFIISTAHERVECGGTAGMAMIYGSDMDMIHNRMGIEAASLPEIKNKNDLKDAILNDIREGDYYAAYQDKDGKWHLKRTDGSGLRNQQ